MRQLVKREDDGERAPLGVLRIGEHTTVCRVEHVPAVGDLIHGTVTGIVETVRIARNGRVRSSRAPCLPRRHERPADPAAAADAAPAICAASPVEAEAEETPKERTDRQLLELLNELRVALPGAQFLFAFLLAVPFASRFGDVSHGLQIVFYVCLLSTLAATILLMAPAVYHRIRWQQGNKTEVIRVAHRMFLAGMACARRRDDDRRVVRQCLPLRHAWSRSIAATAERRAARR